LSYLDLPEEDRVVEDLFHHPPEEQLANESDKSDEPEEHQTVYHPTHPSRGTFTMDHYKIVNQNSCQGLPSDSESTSKLYRRVHKRQPTSEVDLNDNQQPNVSKLWLVADRDVNWFLVLWFVDFYVTP
jgi:hypothetical protein